MIMISKLQKNDLSYKEVILVVKVGNSLYRPVRY